MERVAKRHNFTGSYSEKTLFSRSILNRRLSLGFFISGSTFAALSIPPFIYAVIIYINGVSLSSNIDPYKFIPIGVVAMIPTLVFDIVSLVNFKSMVEKRKKLEHILTKIH